MNEYVNLTKENIANEHLCCAIGDKKHAAGVQLKKQWICDRLDEGHVFRKLNAQGKIFIEYAPVSTAWVPIIGDGYVYVYCLWVAGSFKGKGYGGELLNYAIDDAKANGYKGLCTISSKKKKPFLAEKSFFVKYGFTTADTAGEYELLALPFDNVQPAFSATAKEMKIESKNLTIYYSPQCPYTNNCVDELTEYAKESGNTIDFIKVDSAEKAKSVPCVFNNWATFKDGKFIGNTLLNANSAAKLF